MSFRVKLLALFTLTILIAVGSMAWGFFFYTQRAYEKIDHRRTDALVAQFRQEYAQRGREVARRVQSIADAEATLRMAMDLNRPQADASQYYNDGRGIAQSQQLDYLDIVADDGSLITSAEWPSRFGYKNDWVANGTDWNSQGAFLRRVELADGAELGLLAVRAVKVGDKKLYLIGGQRLDQDLLATLALPDGMRAMFYKNLEPGFTPSALADARGIVAQSEPFSLLLAQVQRTHGALQKRIDWTADGASNSENVRAIPLLGRENDLLGVLLVGSSRQDLAQTLRIIQSLALLAGGSALLLGWIFIGWISSRVSGSVKELTAAVEETAAGRLGAAVPVRARGELGRLAAAFNNMTMCVAEQRRSLVQTERVSAWRELSRRLANELKDPLFPLQLTAESLCRLCERPSGKFDPELAESAATLRAELENLKAVVNRFSEFAKMPAPQFEAVDLNEMLRSVIKSREAQLSAVGRPPVLPELYFEEGLVHPQVDAHLIRKTLEILVRNALDAMPAGGTLTVHTARRGDSVKVELSDTSAGLTPQECVRLFTPSATSRQSGSGLDLAFVQSVVSDHNGKIEVESVTGAGATICIELPITHPGVSPKPVAPPAAVAEIAHPEPLYPVLAGGEEENPGNLGIEPSAKNRQD